MAGELTCILIFRNEGAEVENTLRSIRETAVTHPEVVCVDDASTDGVDYEAVCTKYGARYVRSDVNRGSAMCRDLGMRHVETAVYCFFDAHMRVWSPDHDMAGHGGWVGGGRPDQAHPQPSPKGREPGHGGGGTRP